MTPRRADNALLRTRQKEERLTRRRALASVFSRAYHRLPKYDLTHRMMGTTTK